MSNANEKIEQLGEKINQFIEYLKKEKTDESINEINQRINTITQENKNEIEKIKSGIS